MLPALVPGASAPVLRERSAASALPVGILLYLISVGIIAIATVGVFFGIGFLLLVKPTEAMIPNVVARNHGSEIKPLLYSIIPHVFGETSPADPGVASLPIELEIPRAAAVAALPVAPVAQPSAVEAPGNGDAMPPPTVGDAPAPTTTDLSAGTDGPGSEAPPAATAPVALAASSPAALAAPPSPSFSAAEITELLARGDTFLRMGDLTSARLFYERAADAGDGQAAMRMAASFDPTFLGGVGLRGTRGDPVKAHSWYSLALALSAAEAERQPKSPETK